MKGWGALLEEIACYSPFSFAFSIRNYQREIDWQMITFTISFEVGGMRQENSETGSFCECSFKCTALESNTRQMQHNTALTSICQWCNNFWTQNMERENFVWRCLPPRGKCARFGNTHAVAATICAYSSGMVITAGSVHWAGFGAAGTAWIVRRHTTPKCDIGPNV